MNTLKVHGCPGAGKTEYLLRLIENHDAAYSVYFITFSRNQAAEARKRGSLSSDQCGTFHSVLSRAMGLRREDFLSFMSPDDPVDLSPDQKRFTTWGERLDIWKDLAGLRTDFFEDPCFVTEGLTRGEILMTEFSAARESMRPIYDGLLPGFGRSPRELYPEYCDAKGPLLDYTDILEKALRENRCPPTSLLIVDEAHDLSPLMWAIVQAWSYHAEKVVIAGDSYQAIYGFRGAAPEQFMEWRAKEKYLGNSHRCPELVVEIANRVGADFRTMRYRPFQGKRGKGEVIRVNRFDQVFPFLQNGGMSFVLARTHRLVSRAAKQLIDNGIPFRDLGNKVRYSPWTPHLLECANALVNIAAGREPTLQQREGFIRYLPQALADELGDRPILTFLQSRIDQLDVQGVMRCLRLRPRAGRALWNYNIATFAPHIEPETIPVALGTIHASKGLEAPTVVLLTDVTGEAARAYRGLESRHLGPQRFRLPKDSRDEELRLLFVGVTRASERLVITRMGRRAAYEI